MRWAFNSIADPECSYIYRKAETTIVIFLKFERTSVDQVIRTRQVGFALNFFARLPCTVVLLPYPVHSHIKGSQLVIEFVASSQAQGPIYKLMYLLWLKVATLCHDNGEFFNVGRRFNLICSQGTIVRKTCCAFMPNDRMKPINSKCESILDILSRCMVSSWVISNMPESSTSSVDERDLQPRAIHTESNRNVIDNDQSSESQQDKQSERIVTEARPKVFNLVPSHLAPLEVRHHACHHVL